MSAWASTASGQCQREGCERREGRRANWPAARRSASPRRGGCGWRWGRRGEGGWNKRWEGEVAGAPRCGQAPRLRWRPGTPSGWHGLKTSEQGAHIPRPRRRLPTVELWCLGRESGMYETPAITRGLSLRRISRQAARAVRQPGSRARCTCGTLPAWQRQRVPTHATPRPGSKPQKTRAGIH